MFSTRAFRNFLFLVLCMSMLIPIAAAESRGDTDVALYATITSAMEEQDAVDTALLAEAELGYTFEAPFCLVNPYGRVPLSAVIIFDTAEETTVTMTVRGHDTADDVTAVFPAAIRHILPVVGLYANEANTVELSLPDGSVSVITVETGGIDNEALLKGEVTVPAPKDMDTSALTFVSIGNTQCIAAYDSKGDLRYYALFPARRTSPIRQLSNSHYLVCADNTSEKSDANGGIMEVDLCGRIYHMYVLPGGFHHDMVEMPDGNILIATSQDDIAVMMDTVVEINPETGDIVWKLDLSDIMDSTDGSGTLYREADWSHTNAVDYDEATDTVLLSCRALDAVVAVSYTSKTLRWILGNPQGWTNTEPSLFFTPVESQADFEWNYAQHDAKFLGSSQVLMFDNGTNRYKTVTSQEERNTASYSRAVLYTIDTTAMTITQEWSYGKNRELEWYSGRFCGVDYDTVADVYWICSGTTAYDTIAEVYVANAQAAENPDAVVTLAKIDMVRGEDLIYELVLKAPGYRASRFHPYEYPAYADLTLPGTVYSYIPVE